MGESFAPSNFPPFLLCLGLNLLRPAEVYPHALADEERGQSHIDIPKGPKRRRICQVAKGQGWEGIVISVRENDWVSSIQNQQLYVVMRQLMHFVCKNIVTGLSIFMFLINDIV